MRHKAMLFALGGVCVVTSARADIPVHRHATGDDGKEHFRLHDEGAGL